MSAWTVDERVVRTTLGELEHASVEAPAVLVIGAVAALSTSELCRVVAGV
jgi:siroheme synthase